MKLQNVLIVHKIGFSEQEKKAFHDILEIIKKKKIMYRVVSLMEVHTYMIHERGLIIIVGGDGTFLKTAHAVHTNIPFLCINADPTKTEGFFSQTTAATAEKKIDFIQKGKYKPKKLWRLQAIIDGRHVEQCMNEYYIGEQKPYHVSKYLIDIGKKREVQKSSGVIVSTAAGSTAWCRSAGGKILAIEKRQFQFIVRDPYIGRLAETKIKKGIVEKDAVLTVIPSSENTILVADGVGKEHLVPKNTKVIIKQSEKPLYLFY